MTADGVNEVDEMDEIDGRMDKIDGGRKERKDLEDG